MSLRKFFTSIPYRWLMNVAEHASNLYPLQTQPYALEDLEYIAFSGHHEIAHGIFQSVSKGERKHYANKYILAEVIYGGIKKLRKFLAASAEVDANKEKEFVNEVVKQFLVSCRSSGVYPRELYESLLLWSDELMKLSLLQEALHYYDETIATGVNKYPELYSRALIGKAGVLNTLGKFQEAQSLLSSLADRPYIINDRNLIPDIVFGLGTESLLKGEIEYYKKLLFRGLRHFYTDMGDRRLFVEQLLKTYRRSHKILLDGKVSFGDKVLVLLHIFYFMIPDLGVLRVMRVSRLLTMGLLGYVYALNYFRRSTLGRPEMNVLKLDRLARFDSGSDSTGTTQSRLRRKNILVTRAMGGIGDLLMMTPAFHVLKTKYPNEELHLAIPRRYFPVFQGNTDVKLLDIETEDLDCYAYKKWFNFTDCPAVRVEARSAPKVRKNRIDIFTRASGANLFETWTMDRLPRYAVSPEERNFQESFWKAHNLQNKTVVGIQLRSDEVYRDYPHMEAVARAVSQEYPVLVFDAETIRGFEGQNITKIEGLSMRRAFALVSGCDAIIAPDSAFVHLAAAFDTPCVALYGPIDGKIRTRHYPKCKYLDVRRKLGCLPCWRNDRIPCKLTNMRTSVCMADISVTEIQQALSDILKLRKPA